MTDDTAVLPQTEPPARSRRGWLPVVASVLAVVLVAAGGFAAWRFFHAAGARPAEVLPASTFAMVSVDLDPDGGQKIAAVRTLRTFPGVRENTGLKPDSDLLETLVEDAQDDGICADLDYDRDVRPWVGHRLAVGGVRLGDGRATPVAVLQVTDADRARTGFPKLLECAREEDDSADDLGWTVTEDYLVASDTRAHAEAIVAAGRKAPLSEDSAFQRWTDEAGGQGILNAYVARQAVDVLGDNLEGLLGSGGLSGLSGGSGVAVAPGLGSSAGVPAAEDDPSAELKKALKDFTGAAAVLRFADGGIELSAASGGARKAGSGTVADHVGALPKDTAAVLALAVPKAWVEQLQQGSAEDGGPAVPGLDLFSGMLGLDLPDDLVTLLGSSLSVSVGGDAPADADDVSGPGDLPLGVVVRGDEDKIKDVIAKVESRTGVRLADVPATVVSKDGRVALATQPEYADQLLGQGSLADDPAFRKAVPNAGEAQSVFYVAFDGEWMDLLRQEIGTGKQDREVVDNLEVLEAFGVAGWSEGSTGHVLARLSLK